MGYAGIRIVWDVPLQYARNVQAMGLMGAARELGVAFGLGTGVPGAVDETLRIIVTTPPRLRNVDALAEGRDYRIALIAPFYEYETVPLGAGAPVMAEFPDPRELDRHADHIAVALSELSYAGNAGYMSGYSRNHGIPVMTFPWAADSRLLALARGSDTKPDRDIVLIASYFEKRERLDRWVVPAIAGLDSTVIGPGWRDSTLPDVRDSFVLGGYRRTGVYDELMGPHDYMLLGTWLYRTSRVALNVHHDYECASGYSCNERTFTAAACGALVVSDDNMRVGEFFAEDEVAIARTPAEMAKMVREAVSDADKREEFRKNAMSRVSLNHTYRHRLVSLLNFVRDGNGSGAYCPIFESV